MLVTNIFSISQCFLPFQKQNSKCSATFIFASAKAFNSDQVKTCCLVKKLKYVGNMSATVCYHFSKGTFYPSKNLHWDVSL